MTALRNVPLQVDLLNGQLLQERETVCRLMTENLGSAFEMSRLQASLAATELDRNATVVQGSLDFSSIAAPTDSEGTDPWASSNSPLRGSANHDPSNLRTESPATTATAAGRASLQNAIAKAAQASAELADTQAELNKLRQTYDDAIAHNAHVSQERDEATSLVTRLTLTLQQLHEENKAVSRRSSESTAQSNKLATALQQHQVRTPAALPNNAVVLS